MNWMNQASVSAFSSCFHLKNETEIWMDESPKEDDENLIVCNLRKEEKFSTGLVILVYTPAHRYLM